MTLTIIKRSLIFIIFILFFILAGCKSHLSCIGVSKGGYLPGDGPPTNAFDISAIKDAIPKAEPRSRYGNPDTYSVYGKKFNVMKNSEGYKEYGLASWYGKKWHGRRTSSGEKYDVTAMTAAHPTLPLPSYVRVTNLENGKKVVVKINDRGPFHSNRLIDLSYAAAAKLRILAKGTGHVLVEALQPKIILAKTDFLSKDSTMLHLPQSTNTNTKKYLQFGSFSYKENALALVKSIEDATQKSPTIKPIKIGNKPYYQVKLGPIRKNNEVELLLQRVINAGLTKPLITYHG